MATIELIGPTILFEDVPHSATSYRIINLDNNEIIDESLQDKENLLKWSSELSDGNGGNYISLTGMKAMVKFHFGNVSTDWMTVDTANQLTAHVKAYVRGPKEVNGETAVWDSGIMKEIDYGED